MTALVKAIYGRFLFCAAVIVGLNPVKIAETGIAVKKLVQFDDRSHTF
jgi:hypothetical protein